MLKVGQRVLIWILTYTCVPLNNGKVDNPTQMNVCQLRLMVNVCIYKLSGRCTPVLANVNNIQQLTRGPA